MQNSCTKVFPPVNRNKLDGRISLQKTITNTGWLLLANVFRGGLDLLVGIWLARYLGSEQFGIYNYAIAFVALFSALTTLGLDGIIIRDIVRDPDSLAKTLGTAFVLRLLAGALTLAFALGVITLVRPEDHLIRWMVGIIAAGKALQAFDVIDLWFQSRVQAKYAVYAKTTAFSLASVGKVGLILLNASLIAFAWIGLVEVSLGAVGLVVAYQTQGFSFKHWQGSLKRAKELLKDGWPLIFSGLMVMIYMRIDQIMLGGMVGEKAVGIYSVAVRLAEAWYFIPTAIVASYYPLLIEAKGVNEIVYFQRLQRLYNLLTLISISIAVPVTFFADNFIHFLYGVQFAGAGTALTILVWAGVFVFLGVASHQFILIENYTRIAFLRTFIGAAVNVILNLILIPKFNISGAAFATLISYFIATFSIMFIKNTQQQSIMMLKSLAFIAIVKEVFLCLKKN